MPIVTVNGTAGDDTLVFTAISPDSGFYTLNGGPLQGFSSATEVDVSGGAGSDSVSLNNPVGLLFVPGNGAAGGEFNVTGGGGTDSFIETSGSADSGSLQELSSSVGFLFEVLNEVQHVTVAGSSGSFTLTYQGATTAPLAFNATASAVAAALNALPTIGGTAGSAAVTLTGNVYNITIAFPLDPHRAAPLSAAGTGGAATSVGVDGLQAATLSGVAAVTDTVTSPSFVFTGTSGADAITVADGAVVAGTATMQLSGPSSQTVQLGNKTTVGIHGGGGADSLVFDNPTVASGLVILNVVDVGSITQTGGVNYQDLFISTAGPVTLDGPGNHVFNLAAFLSGAGNAFVYHGASGQLILNGLVTVNGAITAANAGTFLFNNGTIDAGTANVSLSVAGQFTDDGHLIHGGGGVTISADNMDLTNPLTAISAGSGIVTLQPFTAGTAINLGGADGAGVLGLTQAELNTVTAGILRIGDLFQTGDLSITSSITAPPGWNTLSLQTGVNGGITEFAGSSLAVANLLAAGAQAVTFALSTNAIGTFAAASLHAVTLVDSTNLTIGSVDSGLGSGFGVGIITQQGDVLLVSLAADGTGIRLTVGQAINTHHFGPGTLAVPISR